MLPPDVPRADAVFNAGRVGLLIHAMVTNNLDLLRIATEDRLHQPIRGGPSVMPWLNPVVNAALDAGAKGAFLSGAGSSIMAIAAQLHGDRFAQCNNERKDRAIASAMRNAAATVNAQGRVFVTRTTDRGAHVLGVTMAPGSIGGLGRSSSGGGGGGSSAPPMTYRSTRDAEGKAVSFKVAVMQGLAPDGGLYVPNYIPHVDAGTLARWRGLGYVDLAVEVMSRFIGSDEMPPTALRRLVANSYTCVLCLERN